MSDNTSKSTTQFAGKATIEGEGTYKLLAIMVYDTFENGVTYLDKTLKDQTDPYGARYFDYGCFEDTKTADFSKYRVTVKK